MRTTNITMAVTLAILACAVHAASPTTAPTQEVDLTKLNAEVQRIVQQFYPKAKCELSCNQIHFEYDARDFMVHEPLMTGEWQDAFKERGPNIHGIVGDIEFVNGPYAGQADLPQAFDKRYFTLSVFAPYSKRLDAHLHVGLKLPRKVPDGFTKQLSAVLDEFDTYVAKSAG